MSIDDVDKLCMAHEIVVEAEHAAPSPDSSNEDEE